jgi:hyperosmotically inducible protein
MKITQVLKVLSSALIVLAAFNAYAQNSDATATPATTFPSAKEAKAANRALQKNARRALSKAKGLNIANITVRARNGVVTLQGSVPDSQQIDLATRTAEGVSGVVSVKNELIVRAYEGL